jgi:alanine racemase
MLLLMSTLASCPPATVSPHVDIPASATQDIPAEAPAPLISGKPPRPAWVEINLDRLRRNFALIRSDKPARLQLLSVVKDDGYGHGALAVASAALDAGVPGLALSTVEEAVKLREQGVRVPMLLLGDRQESEFPWCAAYDLTCCVSEPHSVRVLARLAERAQRRLTVHLKINTGMNRYGVRWDEAPALAALIASNPSLFLEGALSHFAQSDEADKTFALCQLSRYQTATEAIAQRGIPLRLRHLCNSGGFLDLPEAYFDMVRLGILPLGVFPSSVCRRIPGIEPVMSVKARIAALQKLQPGDTVGYGMRFTATDQRRIAVLPIGYGDGFPRVRNQGFALIRGKRAPLVGGVAMDAITVDVTDIPGVQLWDEAVLMGRQGQEEINVHEMARLRNSVSYDVLTSWRGRLPRIYVG